jgi:hypothetical protein
MEIVAFGSSEIIYRDGGVWVTKISHKGWYALQLKWGRYAEYEAVTRAIARVVPQGARLRREGGATSRVGGSEWLYEEHYFRSYLQWEPIAEEMPLAQVS